MNQIIYKSFDCSVTEKDGIWKMLRNRREIARTASILALGSLLFWGASQGLAAKLSFDEAGAIFSLGASKFFSLFFGAAALACLCILFVKKWRTGWTLDTNARTLQLRSGTLALDDVALFRALAMAPYVKLYAVTRAGHSKFMLKARLKCAPQIEALAGVLNTFVNSSQTKPVNPLPVEPPAFYRFKALIAFVMAAFWLLGGLFFFPNLRFVSIFDPHDQGTPVWIGAVIAAALGVYLLWLDYRQKRAAKQAQRD